MSVMEQKKKKKKTDSKNIINWKITNTPSGTLNDLVLKGRRYFSNTNRNILSKAV